MSAPDGIHMPALSCLTCVNASRVENLHSGAVLRCVCFALLGHTLYFERRRMRLRVRTRAVGSASLDMSACRGLRKQRIS